MENRIIMDEGVITVFGECQNCKRGNRSKVIIDYKKGRSVRKNLLTLQCFSCYNVEVVSIDQVTEDDRR